MVLVRVVKIYLHFIHLWKNKIYIYGVKVQTLQATKSHLFSITWFPNHCWIQSWRSPSNISERCIPNNSQAWNYFQLDENCWEEPLELLRIFWENTSPKNKSIKIKNKEIFNLNQNNCWKVKTGGTSFSSWQSFNYNWFFPIKNLVH